MAIKKIHHYEYKFHTSKMKAEKCPQHSDLLITVNFAKRVSITMAMLPLIRFKSCFNPIQPYNVSEKVSVDVSDMRWGCLSHGNSCSPDSCCLGFLDYFKISGNHQK